jgi:hypothetical protein
MTVAGAWERGQRRRSGLVSVSKLSAYNVRMTPLEQELKSELLAIYDKCSTIRYYPKYFKRMLTASSPRFNRGPVGTVRHLMARTVSPDSGFRRLVAAGKLQWTVEWLIARNPKLHPLFERTDWVIKKAEARVRKAEIALLAE